MGSHVSTLRGERDDVDLKVLMINGSPRRDGNTTVALAEMEKVFAQEGIGVEAVRVGSQDVRGCIACGRCGELGRCVFDDIVNECADKLAGADGLVVGSPVYYASANGSLVSLLDRLHRNLEHNSVPCTTSDCGLLH